MTARPLRVQFTNALYHLTARDNRRAAIFEDERDCARFLALLEQSLARFEVDLHAFVLMGNHFHLLALTRQANLSRWMQWLLAAYTMGFQHRHRRVGHGHVFQGRYQSIGVEAEGYLLALSRYIHLNPVRGRVLGRGELAERRARLRAFPWSSYAGYAGLRRAYPFVTGDLIRGEMGRFVPVSLGQGKLSQAYRRYVEEGLIGEQASPLDQAKAGAVLGSESFVQRVRERLADHSGEETNGKRSRRETTAWRELMEGGERTQRRVDEILGLVGAHYEPAIERITLDKAGRNLEARGVALVLVRERTDWSYHRIGEYFGGMDYAAVAQRIGRTLRRGVSGAPVRQSLEALRVQCQRI